MRINTMPDWNGTTHANGYVRQVQTFTPERDTILSTWQLAAESDDGESYILRLYEWDTNANVGLPGELWGSHEVSPGTDLEIETFSVGAEVEAGVTYGMVATWSDDGEGSGIGYIPDDAYPGGGCGFTDEDTGELWDVPPGVRYEMAFKATFGDINTIPDWVSAVTNGWDHAVQTFVPPPGANTLDSWKIGVRSTADEEYTLSLYEWHIGDHYAMGEPIWMSGPHEAPESLEFVTHDVGARLSGGTLYGIVVSWVGGASSSGVAWSSTDSYNLGYLGLTNDPIDESWGPGGAWEMSFKATFSKSARIKQVSVKKGTLLSGNEASVKHSDNDRIRARARTRPNGAQETLVQVKFKSNVENPCTLDLSVESKLSESGGTAKLFVKNWTKGEYDRVETYSIGTAEQRRTAGKLDAAHYIKGNGIILVQVRHTVASPVDENGFRSYFDQVAAQVK